MNQLAKYKAAIGKRNVASDPSPKMMKDARDTSIGRNKTSTITTSSGSGPGSISSKPTRYSQGSMEGYMHAAPAPIQMNGTGYLNPGAQKARYRSNPPKDFSNGIKGGTKVLSRQFSPHVSDMTRTKTTWNSASILEQNMKLNDMFKG